MSGMPDPEAARLYTKWMPSQVKWSRALSLRSHRTPVELIGPVGHEALQPIQLGALFPTYSGHLVGPSCMA